MSDGDDADGAVNADDEGDGIEPSNGDDGGTGPSTGVEEVSSATWRCAWCGKPQEKNDPPCDNCGHHKFERAVVPAAPDPGEDYVREPVWVCSECGRQHQKNSPPCSRCGNATLEKHVPDEEDFAAELGGTSYWDVLEPQYVLGIAFALVAGTVLVLAVLGVVTLPGMGGDSLQVENVPGSAETANGVPLAEVETAYLEALNERRTDAGLEPLSRNDRLTEVATFVNQRQVKTIYGDGSMPSGERVGNAIGNTCGNEGVDPVQVDRRLAGNASAFDSADSLAGVLLDARLAEGDLSSYPVGRTGVDVHVGPDDRVFLVQLNC